MIALKDIHKSYGSVEVLRGISLEVRKGEVLAIVGPSGAGKSTLLSIMGTLDTPDSGEVLFQGRRLSGLSDSELSQLRCRHMGFVFQQHRLLPEFTLIENVAMPALIAGVARREAFDKAARLVEYMGLSHRTDHRPAELSGGEAQRGAVARALINDPEVVFADEPSGSLDSHNRNELRRLFLDLRRDMGTTFVIVTHDESLAADSDRTIHIRDGRLV